MTASSTTTRPENFYQETVAAHYDRLVEWVVRDWQETPRHRMSEFVQDLWSSHPRPVREVLEICCGTGLMLLELAQKGYRVSGLDQSAHMLARARERLGPDVPLIQAVLPYIPGGRRFDAVLSAAAGLSYLNPAQLGHTLRSVADVLEPGGSFVFDTLSATMLLRHMPARFGGDELATDLGDTAFLWRFSTAPTDEYSDLTYVQFVREPEAPSEGPYRRVVELHRMYVHDRRQVCALAEEAGFTDVTVTDNYTALPAGPATLYDTWTLTLGERRPHADW